MLRQSNAHNRDRDIDPRLDMSQVSPEGALYNYLTMTYRTWMLTGNLQDPDVEESMAKSFDNRKRHLQEQLRIRSASLENLRRDLEAARAEVVCHCRRKGFRFRTRKRERERERKRERESGHQKGVFNMDFFLIIFSLIAPNRCAGTGKSGSQKRY